MNNNDDWISTNGLFAFNCEALLYLLWFKQSISIIFISFALSGTVLTTNLLINEIHSLLFENDSVVSMFRMYSALLYLTRHHACIAKLESCFIYLPTWIFNAMSVHSILRTKNLVVPHNLFNYHLIRFGFLTFFYIPRNPDIE